MCQRPRKQMAKKAKFDTVASEIGFRVGTFLDFYALPHSKTLAPIE